jgi:hypothetical protein
MRTLLILAGVLGIACVILGCPQQRHDGDASVQAVTMTPNTVVFDVPGMT